MRQTLQYGDPNFHFDCYSCFNFDYKFCIQGGPVYVCINQQPWSVNDQLAYVHILKLSEEDICCNCYKLDLTIDLVIGKSMIVQIVNIESDVGAN